MIQTLRSLFLTKLKNLAVLLVAMSTTWIACWKTGRKNIMVVIIIAFVMLKKNGTHSNKVVYIFNKKLDQNGSQICRKRRLHNYQKLKGASH